MRYVTHEKKVPQQNGIKEKYRSFFSGIYFFRLSHFKSQNTKINPISFHGEFSLRVALVHKADARKMFLSRAGWRETRALSFLVKKWGEVTNSASVAKLKKKQQQQTDKQETWSTNTTPLSRSPGMLIFAVEPSTEPGIFVRYRRNP